MIFFLIKLVLLLIYSNEIGASVYYGIMLVYLILIRINKKII